MADIHLAALVHSRLAIPMQGNDVHIESQAEIGDDAVEILERNDLLIALAAAEASEVAGVDGLDDEGDRLVPRRADAGGDR